MKKYFLFLAILIPQLTYAQDCSFCRPQLWGFSPEVPTWPIEYVKIEKVDYERNNSASFCKRPEDMVDTIVIHHTETSVTDTPEIINEFHLSRGTSNDPWLMIGYSFVINSPYAGSEIPKPQVSEGRPLDIVGAHAGSDVYMPMDNDQKRMWDEGKIICGSETSGFKLDPSLIKNGRIKANVTTIGLAVVGNYSPFSKTNPKGYARKNPRYPTKATQDLIARTACQLQKKYPRMKNIKWHNFYHPTSCPGTLKEYISRIKAQTRKYGCEFN